MNEINYQQDFYGWTQEQARLLREGRSAELDVANVVEEIETLGRSEKRELASRLRVLMLHLLKWQHQPTRRGSIWRNSAYRKARIGAEAETGLSRSTFPVACPWTREQVMSIRSGLIDAPDPAASRCHPTGPANPCIAAHGLPR